MKSITAALLGALTIASCQKEIQVDLNAASTQLVIEGAITDAAGPYTVRITETMAIGDDNTYPVVSGAQVIISDDACTVDTLSEGSPGVYKTRKIVGASGRTYNLAVAVRGKRYTATSTMPARVPLDSLRFDAFAAPGQSGVFIVTPIFTDAPAREIPTASFS